jgi:phage terminase large subunit
MPNARKPAITGLSKPHGIVDDVVVPLAKKVVKNAAKKKSVPSRKSIKTQIRANERKKMWETMSRTDGPTKQYYTDAGLATYLAKTKPRVMRKQVSAVRKSYKGK